MGRLLVGLVALALWSAGGAGAPRPKDAERPTLYYPTRVGAKWVYEDSGRQQLTWEVKAVEPKKGGEWVVTVGESDPGGTGSAAVEKVSVSAKGLFKLETGRFEHDPFCLLKHPSVAGDEWEFDLTRQDRGPQPGQRGERGTMTVRGAEEVKVPAGTFKAVRVDVVVTAVNGQALASPARYSKWYAPDVGVVKMTRGKDQTLELKSFSPGKE